MVVRAPARARPPAWVRALRLAAARRIAPEALDSVPRPGMHLVVLREPHYSRIIEGVKRVEGRFCRVRRAPMGAVCAGDILLLKLVGGPVSAWCRAGEVRPFDLNATAVERVRCEFDAPLAHPSAAFWESVSSARFATMIRLEGVREFARPIHCMKKDQRAWVVLRRPMSTIPPRPSNA